MSEPRITKLQSLTQANEVSSSHQHVKKCIPSLVRYGERIRRTIFPQGRRAYARLDEEKNDRQSSSIRQRHRQVQDRTHHPSKLVKDERLEVNDERKSLIVPGESDTAPIHCETETQRQGYARQTQDIYIYSIPGAELNNADKQCWSPICWRGKIQRSRAAFKRLTPLTSGEGRHLWH